MHRGCSLEQRPSLEHCASPGPIRTRRQNIRVWSGYRPGRRCFAGPPDELRHARASVTPAKLPRWPGPRVRAQVCAQALFPGAAIMRDEAIGLPARLKDREPRTEPNGHRNDLQGPLWQIIHGAMSRHNDRTTLSWLGYWIVDEPSASSFQIERGLAPAFMPARRSCIAPLPSLLLLGLG